MILKGIGKTFLFCFLNGRPSVVCCVDHPAAEIEGQASAGTGDLGHPPPQPLFTTPSSPLPSLRHPHPSCSPLAGAALNCPLPPLAVSLWKSVYNSWCLSRHVTAPTPIATSYRLISQNLPPSFWTGLHLSHPYATFFITFTFIFHLSSPLSIFPWRAAIDSIFFPCRKNTPATQHVVT